MNTDCAFYIGSTHEICQDYALAEKNSIAISDGCSSSTYSDIGARVISVTAMIKMKELNSLYNFEEKECIMLARPPVQMLKLPTECLDATLLTSTVYSDSLQVMCIGDGVIAIKTKDDYTIIINCDYKDNYPFYMNYLYDLSGRHSGWLKYHNKRAVILNIISPDGEIISTEIEEETKRLPKELGIMRVLKYKTIIEISNIDIVESVSIMSDGIHSFYETIITETSKYNKSLNYINVLKDLLSFKNFNQSFVQRRINKFRKNCVKKNWANADDFSLATIYIGE